MKYPHSSILVSALVLVVTFVFSSASEGRKQPNISEGIVNGVIYVDDSCHVNKNCNDTNTNQRDNIPPNPGYDVNDVIVVEHEYDHTRCRDNAGACRHYQADDNRVGPHPSVISIEKPSTHDTGNHVNVNPGKSIIPSDNGGRQVNVGGGGGSKTIHRTDGGNTIIHFIGGQPENYGGYTGIPDSWLRDTLPIGSRSSEDNGDTVIQILKNSGKLNGGGYTGRYSSRDRGDKYLQVRPGADSYVYHINSNRGVHNGQGKIDQGIRIVGNHNLHNREGFDTPAISVVPTGGHRRQISRGGIDGGSNLGGYYGGNRNVVSLLLLDGPDRGHSSVTTYPGVHGGSTRGLSGGEGTIKIIETGDGLGSLRYDNIELEGGYGGYGNGRYVEVEDSSSAYDGQIYVPGFHENGNYVPPHYDTLYDYLRHHA